jgi:hypothetical protein
VKRLESDPEVHPRACLHLASLWIAATLCSTASAQEVTLNAFGDMNYGYRFGDPASDSAAQRFEAFGEDLHPKSSHSGFGLAGTDFVLTAELPGDIVYLGELNFQVERGEQSEFEIDVERMFFEKRFVPAINLQAGLFFTPIGYFNRTLYSRAFLMTSLQVPDLFEEELGFVPTHTIGVQVHGQFSLPALHRLSYSVSVGNGRGPTPVANVYARDDDGWRSATAMVEWFLPWQDETRIGLSGWLDRIESYHLTRLGEVRSIRDDGTPKMKLLETGVDVHFVFKSKRLNLILEGILQNHHDLRGSLPTGERTTRLWGALAEVSLNLGPDGEYKPYVRYDMVELPENAGPYFGLRSDDAEITRVYVAETRLGMLGLAWDAASALRLKLEYSVALVGPRERNSIVAQAAFAF